MDSWRLAITRGNAQLCFCYVKSAGVQVQQIRFRNEAATAQFFAVNDLTVKKIADFGAVPFAAHIRITLQYLRRREQIFKTFHFV